MADIDKEAVRADYRRGFSMRQLAAKYDVPKSTVGRWVKQYGWTQDKSAPVEPAACAPPKETGQRDSGTAAGQWDGCEDYAAMREIALLAKDKAGEILRSEHLNARDLRAATAALLDVRTLLGIQTPREAAESELRLLALQRETAQSGGREEVTIRFVDGTEEASG